MNKIEARWRINETLKSKGFRHIGPEADRYTGSINVGHTSVQLDITIPDVGLGKIPIVRILNRSDIPIEIIAHIEQGSGLCFGSQDFLRLDRYRPGESILRVLREAQETLEKSLAGSWNAEISSEYPLYWSGTEIQIPQDVKNLSASCYLLEQKSENGDSTKFVLSTEIPQAARRLKEVHVIHVAGDLAANENIITPKTLLELEKWLDQKSLRLATSFEVVVQQFCNDKIVFFIAKNGAVGCSIKLPNEWRDLHSREPVRRRKSIRRLLVANKSKHQLVHFRGSDTSLPFITRRNSLGDSPTLARRKIALVGCGTIGSHLARYLVQSGAGNDADFLLIDNQLLSAGNLGRHLCNYSDIGEHKARALSNELNRFHPDLQIRHVCGDIVDLWEYVEGADLIVDAVGVEDISDFLNSKAIDIRTRGNHCSILHVWLSGNGIGAQSFLNKSSRNAYYRCLQTDIEQPARFDMRKDVTRESTVMSPSCGEGAYVPYLVDAPIQAACLALNSTHDFFNQGTHPTLRSILFDTKHGKNIKDITPKKSKLCPACNI